MRLPQDLPLGIINAPCLVSVAKETSQAASTVRGPNLVKMVARMPAESYSRAVWLINQDVYPFLLAAGIAVVDAAGTTAQGVGPIWAAPNGLSQTPYGTILGRPIVVTEACPTVGSVGDEVRQRVAAVLARDRRGKPRLPAQTQGPAEAGDALVEVQVH